MKAKSSHSKTFFHVWEKRTTTNMWLTKKQFKLILRTTEIKLQKILIIILLYVNNNIHIKSNNKAM